MLVLRSSQAHVLVIVLCNYLIASSVISLQNGVNRNFLPCRVWPEHTLITELWTYGDWGQFRPCPEHGTNQSDGREQGKSCRKCKEKKLLLYKLREESLTEACHFSVNSVEKLWPMKRGFTVFISCCFVCRSNKHDVEATVFLLQQWKCVALQWKSRSRLLCSETFIRNVVLLQQPAWSGFFR